MSRENVEIVRRAFDAWQSGDSDAAPSYSAEDAGIESENAPGSLTGRAGIAQGFEDWFGAFTDYLAETQDLLDVGDQVVQLTRSGRRGRASGVPVEQQVALISTLGDGRVARVRVYNDHPSALEAAGLSE